MAPKSRSDRPTAAAPAGDLTDGVLFGPIVVPEEATWVPIYPTPRLLSNRSERSRQGFG